MKFAGLILAGGLGKRWGGPKAWARLPDGRCFLEACNTTLQTAGADYVIATLPPDSKDPEIDGLDVLVLQQLALDMFASMRCGLASLIENPSWQTVIVLPVDHPFVNQQTIVDLAQAGHAASIPSFRAKHGHPLAISLAVAISTALLMMTAPPKAAIRSARLALL